tara:strand:+ start:838 stop:1185 length:348 start_codon:yes stop_codon:yes gene_type:complete
MNIIVISIFSLLVLSQLPWWFVVVTSSMVGLISRSYLTSLLNGFLCGALPWLTMFFYKFYTGGELIITRVSAMIGFEHWTGAMIVTILIGGFCGLLGSLCAYSFKKAFKDQFKSA